MLSSLSSNLKVRFDKLTANGDPLVRLNEVIDWTIFSFTLNRAFRKERKSPAGRKPYPRITMFKVLILQSLYNLSDQQAEYQIRDRLSFMRFLDLKLIDDTPDEKTIWAFREILSKTGYIEKLFEKFEAHLNQHGFGARAGSIVDASIVKAPKQRNSKDDNAKIKAGETPESFKENPHMLRQKDVEARWTKKNNQSYYGYKNHINIDANYKLIRSYKITPANTSDIKCIDELLGEPPEPDWRVWADSAYSSEDKIKKITEKGFISRMITKQYKNLPKWSAGARQNTRRSKIRVRVEHVFGFMTNSMKHTGVRTIGLLRAKAKLGLDNLVYNLCRLEQIQRLGTV